MPRLTKKKIERIEAHALGSIYRLNAGTADCYAFTLTDDNEWTGGWDWSDNLVDKEAQYIMMLDTGKIINKWK